MQGTWQLSPSLCEDVCPHLRSLVHTSAVYVARAPELYLCMRLCHMFVVSMQQMLGALTDAGAGRNRGSSSSTQHTAGDMRNDDSPGDSLAGCQLASSSLDQVQDRHGTRQ